MGLKLKPIDSPHHALTTMVDQIAASDHEFEGSGVARAAAFEGVSTGTIYKQLDPDQSEGMPFGRVARLTSKFKATAAAEYLALLAGGVFIPLPAVKSDAELNTAMGRVAKEAGDVLSRLGEALTDGRLTRSEIRDVRMEIREALSVLANLDAIMEQRAKGGRDA